jgi:hypothetical protein
MSAQVMEWKKMRSLLADGWHHTLQIVAGG